METRDHDRGLRFRSLFCRALLFAVAAPLLSLPDAAAPAVRYEPFPVVSRWGAPTVAAELGRFRVPEKRGSESPRTIELAFVRLASTAKHPGAPIVWLSGGPGDSGIADLDTPALRLFLDLRRLGDVIVLDQRGTGHSVPRLDCPGFFQFPIDVPLDRARSVDGLESAARACAERWRHEGVDLSAYNTRESAEDVEDLRIALGAPKLRLLAGSYGTHLALAAIRAHEDRLERAALVGVVGPDHLRHSPADTEEQLARISRLFRASARPPAAAELLDIVRNVLDRLDRRPEVVELPTRDGGRASIAVGRFELAWYTRSLLSYREGIAHLPALYAAMEAGNFRELAVAAAAWRSARPPGAITFAMRCASGSSRERDARVERERGRALLGDTTDFAEERVCRALGVAPLPDAFRSPVRSALPALFVSGTLDGDSPESNADEVSVGFPNAERVRVEGAAHAFLFDDAATRKAIVEFLDGRRIPSARVTLAAIRFESPNELPAGSFLASSGSGAVPPPFYGGR